MRLPGSPDRPLSVLVTGGAGFLGSRLAHAWTTRGASVVSLDIADNQRNVRNSIEHVLGDVRAPAILESLVANADLVLHFAAIAQVQRYIQAPDEVLDVNWNGTQCVLKACLKHRRPVLLASTSEVFGRNPELLREDSMTMLGPTSTPRWCYAASKIACEHLAFGLGRRGLRFTIVRYFNVYGPLLDAPGAGRVMAQFLGALREGRPLPLVDGGNAVRSFCFVDDAIDATMLLAEGLVRGDAPWTGRAVHVGRREPVTIRDLAAVFTRLSGQPHGVVEVSGQEFFGPGFEDVPCRVPDVSYLEKTTGFHAAISLDEGVRRTLRHWRLLANPESPAPPPRLLPMIRPVLNPTTELLQTMGASLRSGRTSNDGPLALKLERSLAEYLGAPDAALVGSGAAGLLLVAHASGLRGKVVLPSFTYIATLAAFTHRGLTPVFCDVDAETFTLSPAALAVILSEERDIAAIVPVNVFGVPPDLPAIEAMTRTAGIRLLYDNAHGFGTEIHGQRTPAGPAAQVMSLHVTKTMPSVEGGLVLSPDASFLKEIRRLRNHGLARPLEASSPGYNARSDELRAAVGLHSLAGFPEALERRRTYGQRLSAALVRRADSLFRPQRIPFGVSTNYQNFAVTLTRPVPLDAVIEHLKGSGVEARRYFWPPLHHLESYRGVRALPVTDALERSLICLPLYSAMNEEELVQIESALDRASEDFPR